jgi:hypothetical protein
MPRRDVAIQDLTPDNRLGHEAAYFSDPDGNIVAVARPVD